MNVHSFAGFPAAAVIAADKAGIELLVVVAKCTFEVEPSGDTRPAKKQVELKFADEHYGEPETTSVRYEHDFAPFKPMCDVIVNGSACAPGGRPSTAVAVEFQFGKLVRRARVVGDRMWRSRWFLPPAASRPKRFTRLPIVWERAFGGSDTSPKNPKKHVFETRNLLGVGIHSGAGRKAAVGSALPNVEEPGRSVRSWKQRRDPVGFGFVPRGSAWRLRHAGTYDAQWLENRCPFLPDDFDERYYQGAPPEQIVPYPRGGERVRLMGFTPEGTLEFRLPEVPAPPMRVRFPGGYAKLAPNLDTIVIEPDERRVILSWRARAPLPCKPTDVGMILVGTPTRGWERSQRTTKSYVDWKRFHPPVEV
jgi:hypothetical protein